MCGGNGERWGGQLLSQSLMGQIPAYLHEGAAMVTLLLLGVLVDELVQEVGQ